jgi:integrase
MRDVFDSDDLTRLFVTSKEYSQDTHRHPHNFWVPLLGLFTGCRLEEICQLYVKDIGQVDGVWGLDIKEDKPDKSVKTHEQRFVPLHPILVKDLKFVDFVKSFPNQAGRVFPELKRINNRYGHSVSQWFGRFCKRYGVKTAKKAFHSFRHTVADHLKQKDVRDSYIAQLEGHKEKSITMGRYGKRYDMKKLYKKTILKLDFGIDLTPLKNSKFVVK